MGDANRGATGATALLAALRSAGFERLYLNAGTDFAPLVDAFAGSGGPAPTIAAHESVVVGMAHGAYLATGRPQALMVHVSVGTANALCGIMNAARERVPLVVLAGRTPVSEHGRHGARDFPIHWAQELFDQNGLIRELVKWDYEVRDAAQIPDVVGRAVAIATSQPCGPVYISLGREALAMPVETRSSPAAGGATAAPASPPAPDPAVVARCAELLAGAELPVIVTSATGLDHSTVPALGSFATRHAVGIVEERPRYVNVRHDHEFHLGYRSAGVLASADVVCVLDCDVPWLWSEAVPREDATVIQVGADPLFGRYPMRTHRSDLTVTATPAAFLSAVDTALAERAPFAPGRAERLAALSSRGRAGNDHAPAAGATISRARLNAALGGLVDDDTVVFSEYWADIAALGRTRPGTFFGLSPAGGLGWALPAAIGAKLAAPQHSVIAAVGDGAYLFANPAAAHHAAAMHASPVLTIVNKNARWGAVDAAASMMYPGLHPAGSPPSPFADLAPIPELDRYVAASGGVGFSVESPNDLDDVLREAKRVVDVEGRQAVVDVRTA